jgi:hypothetical protein
METKVAVNCLDKITEERWRAPARLAKEFVLFGEE